MPRLIYKLLVRLVYLIKLKSTLHYFKKIFTFDMDKCKRVVTYRGSYLNSTKTN